MVVELCSEVDNPAMVYELFGGPPIIIATFRDVLEVPDYTLKISVLVNGKVVSAVSKGIDNIEQIDDKIEVKPIAFEESANESESSTEDTAPLLFV